ncbi:hypothetical protein DZS_04210 [Dickeya ananatis]
MQKNDHFPATNAFKRVLIKHIVDPSAQLLMLQKGDVDIARNLTTEQIRPLVNDSNYHLVRQSIASVMLLSCNTANEFLKKPQVWQAIKWALDYDSIQKNILPLTHKVHQSFLPGGFPAALDDNPFHLDVAKAKALLKDAGYPDGFDITLDHYSAQPYPDIAQAIQTQLGAIGIRVKLIAAENRQVLTKMRARQQQLALTAWGADYFDPNSNAEAFCINTDNSDGARNRTLAWRCNWSDEKFNQLTEQALHEQDPAKRIALYETLQRNHREQSPFTLMMQDEKNAGLSQEPQRRHHDGLKQGALPAGEESLMQILIRFCSTLGSLLLTLLGLSVLTFFIGRIMPTDPVLAAVGDNAPQAVVERVRQEMGLDQPLWVQYGHYLNQLLHGDLGRSVLTSNPVTTDIARYFPATLELATAAIIVAALVGIPLGVWAAVRQGRWVDQVIRVICLAGHSLPVFVLALLSLLVFYAVLGIAPGPGRQDILFQDMVPHVTGLLTVDSLLAGDYDALRDALAHMVQPVLILAYFSMAYITRMTRTFMLNALSGEFVITARAKGLSSRRVVWRHAFPTVAVQLVTVLALTYAGLLEGAVVTENVFSWPGLGQYLTTALLNADMNPVVGATLLVGAAYVLLNLLADILYRLLDPRVT